MTQQLHSDGYTLQKNTHMATDIHKNVPRSICYSNKTKHRRHTVIESNAAALVGMLLIRRPCTYEWGQGGMGSGLNLPLNLAVNQKLLIKNGPITKQAHKQKSSAKWRSRDT